MSTVSTPHPADALGRFAATTGRADLGPTVVSVSKLHVLDAIAVLFAAGADPIAGVLARWGDASPQGPCHTTVGARLAARDAAFVTSSLMHALDFDDMAFGGHGSSCVLGGVLAVGEQHEIDGATLLTAYATGMELFGKLEDFDHSTGLTAAGWHATSVRGLLGACAGVTSALRCSPDEAAHALTISLASGSATIGSFGSMVKPIHAGLVAQSAVRSAELAVAGLTGRPAAFDGAGGFGQVYFGDKLDWTGLAAALGRPFRVETAPPTIKLYPSCAGNQRAIASVRRIMQRAELRPDDLARIDVHIDPELPKLLTVDWPVDRYEAKFSLKFNVAAAVLDRAQDLTIYEQEDFADPALISARDRIVLHHDRPGLGHGAAVVLTTHDGHVLSDEQALMHGSARDPLTESEVVAKFHACAARYLPTELRGQVIDAVLDLDHLPAATLWPLWRAVTEAAAQVSRPAATHGSPPAPPR